MIIPKVVFCPKCHAPIRTRFSGNINIQSNLIIECGNTIVFQNGKKKVVCTGRVEIKGERKFDKEFAITEISNFAPSKHLYINNELIRRYGCFEGEWKWLLKEATEVELKKILSLLVFDKQEVNG